MKKYIRLILVSALALVFYGSAYSQGCCSGGAGSPIAGGAATGVLQKDQMEVSSNYQFIRSNKFRTQNRDTVALFDNLSSKYLFSRVDYGISERLTMSVATGYYLNKALVEIGQTDTISSSGMGDLILFPRVDVFNKRKNNWRTEITLGLGLKIPIGSHNDSNLIFSHPLIGDVYAIAPPTVQTTNGSMDMMFYTFIYHAYPKKKLRFFANSLYVKKGFNSLGEKFGDYASLGLFAGKTLFMKLGLTAQVKGEWVGKMEAAKNISLASYNIDPASTGSKKIFFVPQISFTQKSLTLYVTSEIPLYQNLVGVQVSSQYQFTTGLSYRFFAKKPSLGEVKGIKISDKI
ncbi:MAG TPA: hypothetical protein EYQ86_06505 [Bacteroidetes bacterium]|nr:hypothetical protein [Bacteroidota bacterium]